MKTRNVSDTGWAIFCPACQCGHAFDPRWAFNGSHTAPTFSPSMLVRFAGGYGDPPKDVRCHFFVREGRIEFLSDSTHALAGQTVDLPEWPS